MLGDYPGCKRALPPKLIAPDEMKGLDFSTKGRGYQSCFWQRAYDLKLIQIVL